MVDMCRTDIWFEETDVGEVNRQRLAAALSRMAEAIDVIDVEVESDKYLQSDLKRFFPELYIEPTA